MLQKNLRVFNKSKTLAKKWDERYDVFRTMRKQRKSGAAKKPTKKSAKKRPTKARTEKKKQEAAPKRNSKGQFVRRR